MDELRSLRGLQTATIYNKERGEYVADSTAVGLANSYHPHRFGVICNDKRTALHIFGRDHLLRKAIEKCVKMQGGINDAKLRSMLSIFEGVQVASNFPPGTAKAIYETLLRRPGRVWDMSCGFGGRLLAALSTDAVEYYYGTEPSSQTFKGLCMMERELRINWEFPPMCETFLAMQGSETILPDEWKEKVDLCFTSPPYFNTEKYSREESQSFLRYPYRSEWTSKFIGGTIQNCLALLKPDGLIAVNIANVNSYKNLEQDFVREVLSHGLTLLEVRKVVFSVMPGKGKRNRSESSKGNRTEPLFIFKRS